jgi:hypothetical protein
MVQNACLLHFHGKIVKEGGHNQKRSSFNSNSYIFIVNFLLPEIKY